MLVVFLGPPGSGKGTQSKIVSTALNYKHASTGDMLRETAKGTTLLGKELGKLMSEGALVSDSMVNEIVAQTLKSDEYKNGCILDGYPRTLEQALFLETINIDNYIVVHLKIESDKLGQRIESRYICLDCGAIYNTDISPKKEGICDCGSENFEHRADDNAVALLKRIDLYEDQISMILDFYRQRKKLVAVDADKSVEEVTKQILESIKNIDFV